MVKRIEPGHYRIGGKKNDPTRKGFSSETTIGVIRGDVANEMKHGKFGNQYGFQASKWYAYKCTQTEVTPKLKFSPTAPASAFQKHFNELEIVQDEFTSKKNAVEHAESEWEYILKHS